MTYLVGGGEGADIIDGGEGDRYCSSTVGRVQGSRLSLSVDKDKSNKTLMEAHGFTANNNQAVGDILTNIENICRLQSYNDWLTGDGNDNTLKGGGGNDRLEGGAGDDILDSGAGDDTLHGGAGTDTYAFSVSGGTDTIVDEAGDTMTLRFSDYPYLPHEAEDFVEASDNFNRVGNNLVITIDLRPDDDITDKITILDAYDSDPNTGTGNSAFTINIEYGGYRSDTFTAVTTEAFWHTLT